VFIAFEGGEGAGKSTQVRRLQEWLASEGLVARATFEPGATPSGAGIRAIVLDRAHTGISPRSEALLYAADRAQHVHDVLRPALEAGEIVITDRFVDSSLAYQGAGRTIPLDEVRTLSRWATQGLLPDLTVLLDLPPEVGLARARGRAVADRLESESLEFHQRVRQTFLALAEAEPDRYLVIDARRTPEEIAARIRQRVTELLSALPLETLAKTRPPKAAKPARPADATAAPAEHDDTRAEADDRPAPQVSPPRRPHHPHAQTGPTPQLHP
jgi:dTMP kinase